MRRLLKVLALTLAVVLSPRIALAHVLVAAAAPVERAETATGATDVGKGRHPVGSTERSDADSRPIGRCPTWGFARRWSPTSRSELGRLDAIRGFGGLAPVDVGREDDRETRSQRRVSLFRGVKVQGARHDQNILRSLRPVWQQRSVEPQALEERCRDSRLPYRE